MGPLKPTNRNTQLDKMTIYDTIQVTMLFDKEKTKVY